MTSRKSLTGPGLGFFAVTWMTIIALLFVFAFPAQSQTSNRTVIGTSELDGLEIVVYDDGFWHYSENAGVQCIDVYISGQVCATGSEWSIFPNANKQIRPTFISQSDDGYLGELDSLGAPGKRTYKDQTDIRKFILWRIRQHSGVSLSQLNFNQKSVGNRKWYSGGFIGDRGPEIVSYTINGDVVVIAATVELNTKIMLNRHKKRHVDFLRTLRF